MQLTQSGICNPIEWLEKGYEMPQYDRQQVKKKTDMEPVWIHFGAGNIFRAFPARIVQDLLNHNQMDTGLIVAEGYDYEMIEVYKKHDNLSILATLKADGTVKKTVIGSITEALVLDSNQEKAFSYLKESFRKDSLQMVSFTITEKGYQIKDANGNFLESILQDGKEGPQKPQSYIGKISALLYERYLVGKKPVAMVSMDNCSHNGELLFQAIFQLAAFWVKNGLAEDEFLAYIKDRKKVSFPWSMIDKITPRPSDSIKKQLDADGIKEMQCKITSQHTYIAPFVNAEECEYLIIEDNFPNGRPPLEQAGIFFTDRETVEKAEKMKVCTCLNPLHTALAIFGCLLGYQQIAEEMKNPDLKRLVEQLGYQEGLPVVKNPGILDPKQFLDQVIQIRLPNPFIPDSPQRIATDTSQKLAIRFGETLKAYRRENPEKVTELKAIPLVFAGWLRYLMGVDDQGEEMKLSADPMLSQLSAEMKPFHLGETPDVTILENFLKNKEIFGVDLIEINLAKKVEEYFIQLTAKKGAVAETIKKVDCLREGQYRYSDIPTKKEKKNGSFEQE